MTISLFSPFFFSNSGTPSSDGSSSEKIKSECSSPSTKSTSSLHSPKEAVQTPQESQLPEESNSGLSSLPGSPGEQTVDEGPNFTKLSVYSPTSIPEPFSVPENIATEAQISTSLPTAAVPEVQGAKSFYSESEYSASSNTEVTGGYYSPPSTTRGYSFSQSSVSPTPLMSPYPAGYSHTATEGMITPGGSMYPTACLSPTYMSPYGTGKQYTWPAPTSMNYGAFGMNSHDLMQSGYSYQPSMAAAYSQMAMTRASYPASYYPTSTAQSC